MQRDLPDDDLYGTLGVQTHAAHAEITRAYRKLAMTWHPDRNAAHGAEDRFKRIRLAYEILRDPQRRAEYDRRASPRSVARARAQHAGTAPEQPPRPQSETSVTRAGNLSRRIAITLDQQVLGCRVKLKLTRTEYCATCRGVGHLEAAPAACPRCRGRGRVRKSSLSFFLFGGVEIECDACGGKGTVLPTCPACAGSGSGASKTGYLRFDIPAGVRPDSTKRVRGFGRPARPGEVAGDLLVKIAYAAHPLFEPDFPHLRCDMPISAFRVLAGGSIDVPTLDAAAAVALPQDAADGTQLCLAGHGLLDGASGQRGDLFVTLRVVRPHSLTPAQRALVEELERSLVDPPGQADAFDDWARRVAAARRHHEKTARRSV